MTSIKTASFWLDVQMAPRFFAGQSSGRCTTCKVMSNRPIAGGSCRCSVILPGTAPSFAYFSAGALERAPETAGCPARQAVRVPMGHYIDYYPNQISRTEARTRLGLAPDDFCFALVGQHSALQRLARTDCGVFTACAAPLALVIAGQPYIAAYAKEIAQLAQTDDRIRLL